MRDETRDVTMSRGRMDALAVWEIWREYGVAEIRIGRLPLRERGGLDLGVKAGLGWAE